MVFGVLSIGCGIIILYNFAIHLLSKPWIALEYNWIQWVSSSFVIFPLALTAGFIVSGFGLLGTKPWSRYLLLITTEFALWDLVNRMIILGPCTEEYFYLSCFFIGGLFIWFLNQKSIRTRFPYRKGLKIITIVWIIVLSLEILGAGIFWFKYGGYKIPRLQKVVYESKDESFYSENYFRSPFPLEYTLAIPNGFTLHSLNRDNNNRITVFLTSPKKGLITMGNQTLFQELQATGRMLGYNDSYRLSQKFFSERYGLVFMILRSTVTPMGIYQVEEVQINGLNGFIQKGSGKTLISEYYLFQGRQAIGGGTIAGRKGRSLNKQQIDEIISSIKLQNKPLKSAQEFFQEGVKLFNRQDFEKAKFSFASALCLDWQNSQYHYYLGYAFFKTENWNSAKKHAEKAISLQPDYLEAQKLLDEVKGKQISEK